MKNNSQSKSLFIQFRVDSEVKNLAKQTANEFFNGNMSDMFRYALHNCNFEADDANHQLKSKFETENKFTNYTSKNADWLVTIHEDYERCNCELNRIGTNLNQIAHHVNSQSLACRSPVTNATVDQLTDIRKSINSLRTTNANKWKDIKNSVINNTNNKYL